MDKQLLSLLLEISDVHEVKNRIILDAHVIDQLFHVSVRCLDDVGEETVLELGVSLLFIVSSDLSVELVLEDALVPQNISHLGFIDWHPLLISPVHGLFLESVPILGKVVLLLTYLRELLLEFCCSE